MTIARQFLIGSLASFLAACAGASMEQIPHDGPESTRSVAAGNTAFAVDLYAELQTETDGNVFISPASISTAFGLAYAGAQGDAAREIAEVLHYDLAPDAFHPAMGALAQALQLDSEGRTLRINNAVWLDKSLIVEPNWLELTADHYNAEDVRADFRNAPTSARLEINRWVEDKTEDRIQDLLGSSHVNAGTRAVLVNTIYLDADWADPFEADATRDEPFYLTGGQATDVAMMNQTDRFRHYETRNLQAVQLPYKGDELSMVVLLPKTSDGLGDIEKDLSANRLVAWLSRLAAAEPVRVELKLPKLKLEDKYELARPFQRLGLTAPFSGDPAHFTGMVDPARQADGQGVSIDQIVHQTFLEVDEKGTEAAAATAIAMRTASAMTPPPPPPIQFHADHPFLLLLKHNETGAILFLGRVVDPR